MIREPHITQRALLTWQRPLGVEGNRDRHAVAELVRAENGIVSFRYLDIEALALAREAGFDGYPGLPENNPDLSATALEVLRRRLPPSDRPDFLNLLNRHGLPENRELDDLSLLAYTGARMTGDSFGVCETFEGFERPFSYVFDVAGYRFYQTQEPPLEHGESLTVMREPDNEFDSDAVKIQRENGSALGHINRLQAPMVGRWLSDGEVTASVFRVNGRAEYPRLFILAKFSAP